MPIIIASTDVSSGMLMRRVLDHGHPDAEPEDGAAGLQCGAMPSTLICHESLEFVNGKQRCLRCGKTLSPSLETALDVSFVFCEDVTGSSAQSIARPATLRPNERWCDLRPWVDELGHVAGPAHSGEKQRCARCGEPVRIFAGDPAVPAGAIYILRYEHRGDGDVEKTGHLVPVPSMERDLPMCVTRS